MEYEWKGSHKGDTDSANINLLLVCYGVSVVMLQSFGIYYFLSKKFKMLGSYADRNFMSPQ